MPATDTKPTPRQVADVLDADATEASSRRGAAAPVAYALRGAHVAHLLTEVAAGLELHRQNAAGSPRDWGYVGDLDHVAELLDRVVLSLPGNDDQGPVIPDLVGYLNQGVE